MKTITYSQIQKLLRQLPVTKLAFAYKLLVELADKKADMVLPQLDFMHLPLHKRRRIMAQQAEQIGTHYEQTANERQEWQAGDFIDEN